MCGLRKNSWKARSHEGNRRWSCEWFSYRKICNNSCSRLKQYWFIHIIVCIHSHKTPEKKFPPGNTGQTGRQMTNALFFWRKLFCAERLQQGDLLDGLENGAISGLIKNFPSPKALHEAIWPTSLLRTPYTTGSRASPSDSHSLVSFPGSLKAANQNKFQDFLLSTR